MSFLSTEGWRRQFAHVPQRMMLLDGTIVDNIAKESTDLIDLSSTKSPQAACLLDLSTTTPKLDAAIGGMTYSGGGQRQRLCIARAFIEIQISS